MSENDQAAQEPQQELGGPEGGRPPSQVEQEELAAAEEPRDITQPDVPADQARAPEAESAQKYAADGVVGAPGSETPGGGRPAGEMTPVPSGIKGDEPGPDDPRMTAAHADDPEVAATPDAEKAAEPGLNPPGSPDPGTPAVGGPHEASSETQAPAE